MGSEKHAHRPGPLKQTNKPHKTGRHRSKGEIDNALKGRVSIKAVSRKNKQEERREQRRNRMNQIRKNKREEILNIKRQLGGDNTAPFLVCLLPLHLNIDAETILSALKKCDSDAIVYEDNGITHITIPRFKQRYSFIIPPVGFGSELEVLDYLKVCDTTVLLISALTGEDDILDKWGYDVFNMISSQGIPTPIVALTDVESVASKRKLSTKAAIVKYISKILPHEKVVQLGTNAEGMNLFRKIGEQKKNTLHNKANRPHLFGEKIEFIGNEEDDKGTLKVTGFLRGCPLDVNGLVHIPGLGDFQIKQVEKCDDPYKIDRKNRTELDVRIPDSSKQVSLQRENIPDEMDAEQTWPTEEEIATANEETKKSKLIKRVQKGMSDYQACWIPDVEEVEDDDNDSEDDDNEEENEDEEYMSCESEVNSDDEIADAVADEQLDNITVSEAPINDEKYDEAMDLQEERETFKKLKEARIDQLWPDEIDTPLDVPARERFQKYRGLESFRTSPWDPKENLPSDYARIYQFKNFDRTKRRILKETKNVDGVMPGWYVKIHILNVSVDKWNEFRSAKQTNNVIVYGILPHEHQMSVVNVVLKRVPFSRDPIKSKEKLIIQCGYRRFVVNPIFSQHTNGTKHKYERYFHPDTVVVATFYAPIQFPPAPVLCFKENSDTTLNLVARGSLLSCNPDRVILKRIVLSGHPLKINRKSATVRYMFFNKEDVEYFKPIKLRTKCGRLGHIKESLGTHGHMKCIFDGQLKSYDTVFMYMYKRIFPKWNYEDCIVSCEKNNSDNAPDHDMKE